MTVSSHSAPTAFHPLRIVIPVLLLLVGISLWANWYTDAVSIPRYCENPQQTLIYLQDVITKQRPAGDEGRRSHLIAAKLLFLVPQQANETVPDYIHRIEQRLRQDCR